MSLEIILLIVVVVISLAGLIGFIANANRPRRRSRRFLRDESGNIRSLDGRLTGDPIPLEGKGTYTSSPTQLSNGRYVLSYELHAPTRVALIAQQDGDEETILLSDGAGLKEFAVEAPGSYLWHVETNFVDSPWRIIYRPVQRQGR